MRESLREASRKGGADVDFLIYLPSDTRFSGGRRNQRLVALFWRWLYGLATLTGRYPFDSDRSKSMAPLFGAARYVCEKGGWQVSNLKLQKILYLAHMVHMGRTGKRLFETPFPAWDYGPVQPDLYRKLRGFGSKSIPDIFYGAGELTPDDRAILDEACRHLLDKTPGQLVQNTHTRYGAWAKNYVPGVMGITIPDADILGEYRHRVDRGRGETRTATPGPAASVSA